MTQMCEVQLSVNKFPDGAYILNSTDFLRDFPPIEKRGLQKCISRFPTNKT